MTGRTANRRMSKKADKELKTNGKGGFIGAPCRLVVFPEFGLDWLPQKQIWFLNMLTEKKESNTMADWHQIRRQVIERRRDIFTPSKGA